MIFDRVLCSVSNYKLTSSLPGNSGVYSRTSFRSNIVDRVDGVTALNSVKRTTIKKLKTKIVKTLVERTQCHRERDVKIRWCSRYL